MTSRVAGVLIVVALALPSALSCNGYKFKLESLRPCMNNSVLRFKNFNFSVGEDCIVYPQGCVVASKEITKAMLKWNMKKGIISLGGSADGCKEMESSSSKDAAAVLGMMGFPQKCPIPQGRKCPTSGIDISKYKEKLGRASGRLTGKVTADHGKDVGGTCFTFSLLVSKR